LTLIESILGILRANGLALGLNGALTAIVLPIVLPLVFAALDALHR
jgi:hypothetical protein